MPRELTQWKPGQSGNPNGRPRGRTLVERLRAAIQEPTTDGQREVADLIVEAWIAHTIRGSTGHLVEMLERLEGKVPNAEPEPAFSLSELTEEAEHDADEYRPDERPDDAGDGHRPGRGGMPGDRGGDSGDG
jgi:hypothetical protein